MPRRASSSCRRSAELSASDSLRRDASSLKRCASPAACASWPVAPTPASTSMSSSEASNSRRSAASEMSVRHLLRSRNTPWRASATSRTSWSWASCARASSRFVPLFRSLAPWRRASPAARPDALRAPWPNGGSCSKHLSCDFSANSRCASAAVKTNFSRRNSWRNSAAGLPAALAWAPTTADSSTLGLGPASVRSSRHRAKRSTVSEDDMPSAISGLGQEYVDGRSYPHPPA
mmetsp:Transcript_59520/g.153272  ORF Transcript_59520/g.153272 Transcript_59520/m.153272 type:complete len:233 (-) Transcript_59520:14-712(-)